MRPALRAPDLRALETEIAELTPRLRDLALRTRSALVTFERTIPDDSSADYEAAFVGTGAAALIDAYAALAELLTDTVADLHP